MKKHDEERLTIRNRGTPKGERCRPALTLARLGFAVLALTLTCTFPPSGQVLVSATTRPTIPSTGVEDGAGQVNRELGLVGKVIVLDAGHGGPDGGAQGAGGVLEKDITLPITLKLSTLLRQSGATVYVTRVTDRDLASDGDRAQRRRHKGDLRSRTRFVLSKHPDAFVSIHCNAVSSPSWHGAQMIYMRGNDKAKGLAEQIQGEFKQHLLPTSRLSDDMSTLYLLKRIPGAAVLAEVGFISNPEEAKHLQSDGYQQQVATVIYVALLKYFHVSQVHPSESAQEHSTI